MPWRWLLAPLLPWLLRAPSQASPAGGARTSARLALGRAACGVLWYESVHGAVHALGEGTANAIYHDQVAAVLAAGRAAVCFVAAVLVAWMWQRTRPRPGDFRFAAAAIVACTAFGIAQVRTTGAEPAHFGNVLAMYPNMSLLENVPSRPVVRYWINDRGFRGPTFQDAKPAGTVRGVIVGDSFVFGNGVELPDTLSESLKVALAERGAGATGAKGARAYEIINLGIGGDNLPSHVEVYLEAVRRLAPDFVVLCLDLPNDLTDYDDQVTRRAEMELGTFTLARWAFGPWLANWMWSVGRVPRAVTPEALRVLDRHVGRIEKARAAGPSPPLLVYTYRDPGDAVRERLQAIPGSRWVTPPEEDPSYFIPIDGHPTGAGNRAAAARIAELLDTLPGLGVAAP